MSHRWDTEKTTVFFVAYFVPLTKGSIGEKGSFWLLVHGMDSTVGGGGWHQEHEAASHSVSSEEVKRGLLILR